MGKSIVPRVFSTETHSENVINATKRPFHVTFYLRTVIQLNFRVHLSSWNLIQLPATKIMPCQKGIYNSALTKPGHQGAPAILYSRQHILQRDSLKQCQHGREEAQDGFISVFLCHSHRTHINHSPSPSFPGSSLDAISHRFLGSDMPLKGLDNLSKIAALDFLGKC